MIDYETECVHADNKLVHANNKGKSSLLIEFCFSCGTIKTRPGTSEVN